MTYDSTSRQDLRSSDDEPIRFFLPGPSYVLSRVRDAQTRATVAHRSAEFNEVYERITGALPPIFRTESPVVTATGSATLLLQAAVQSCVERRVLHLVCGAFSQRWLDIGVSLGLEADRVEVPPGRPITPDLVRAALRRGRYEAVTVVHSETSTGVLNPLREIAEVIRSESDALILVDAVSSLAGAILESDGWGLDVVVTASQKALAVPPGVSLASVSPRAEERMSRVGRRGYYTDLQRYLAKHRSGGTLSTPAESVYWALDAQLGQVSLEGLEERWKRHQRLQKRTLDWAQERGVELAAEKGFGSPTVSALKAPRGWTGPQIVSALADRGFTLGAGYAELKPTTFRIGHMGEIQERDLEGLLDAMDDALKAPPPSQSHTLRN
ncbi:MAG: alanine--glyoxylate aminotransferase family protein [Thermoanaerobaculia bacterium]|nr:alanine--glyoxylate aminotransferase family protein [Thermoanaerobaculia bacterium]